jgi:hypothetical protein
MTIVVDSPEYREIVGEIKSVRADYEATITTLNTLGTRTVQITAKEFYKDGNQKVGVVDAPGSSLLGLADAVGSPLLGNAASGNEKNDYAGFAFCLPQDYKAGGTITVRLRAKVADTLLTVHSKVDVECKLLGDGALGSDICGTAAQQVTTAYANYDFSITATNLVAGDVLHFRVATLANDTGATVNKAMSIVKVSILYQSYLASIAGAL